MNSIDYATQSTFNIIHGNGGDIPLVVGICAIAALIPLFINMHCFNQRRKRERSNT